MPKSSCFSSQLFLIKPLIRLALSTDSAVLWRLNTHEGSRMPNLLFLYTDEQRFDTLACMGNDRIDMPNLNRLAERSTVFERAYCTQPVCTPSRGSIVTGLHSQAHGATNNNIHMNFDVKCLPEYLPAGEYHCAHMGKWHLGDEIFPQHGFTEWCGTEDTYHSAYSPPVEEFGPERSPYHHWLLGRGITPDDIVGDLPPEKRHPAHRNRFFRGQVHALPEEHCKPAFLAERAGEFLHINRQRPWVLYINFLEPHPPNTSCRNNQYDPADVTLPYNWDRELNENQPLRMRLGAAPASERSEQSVRERTARYWGMCSLVDTYAGRILDTLEETGQADNTIIVFTTDHGDMLGSFGRGGKSSMFDESACVPLLIRAPGQQEQRKVACPVSQVDLVPTLLDMMGQPVPGELHGASLRPEAEGASTATDRDVFIQWGTGPKQDDVPVDLAPHQEGWCTPEEAGTARNERVRTIVTPDCWKFSMSSVGDHELYDLNADPMERSNRYSDPSQQDRIREYEQRVEAWQSRVS